MFTCEICGIATHSVSAYCYHLKVHQNIPNYQFPCPAPDCTRKFSKYESLKSHIHRNHPSANSAATSVRPTSGSDNRDLHTNLICEVFNCGRKFRRFVEFQTHLRSHITKGEEIQCPYKDCDKRFSKKSSYSAHLSRNHRNCSPGSYRASVHVLSLDDSPTCSSECVDNFEETDQEHDKFDSLEAENFQEQYTENLALFYLKLQAKCLLPSSIIQTVISEFQTVHDLERDFTSQRLQQKLVELDVTENQKQAILEEFNSKDLLKSCNSSLLRTDYTRKAFFKKKINYVPPVPIYLGKNTNRRECFSQYVSLLDSLKALFHQKSVREQHSNLLQSKHSESIFEDITDGKTFKRNELFQNSPNSVKVLLYQDAFEVVNPLGSAKKKHKVLGVYFTLADFYPYNRSNIDHMQLVLLCKERDLSYFGQEKIFSTLICDLKKLEQEGISVDAGTKLKGTLCAILGDNLGSHQIGGFVENFSTSSHICRYCTLANSRFKDDVLACGATRTIQKYDAVVSKIEKSKQLGFVQIVEGIKHRSPFNSLQYFHVCQPGLAPCLGHDLFEGVVSYDLALCIRYFVHVKKWFTYNQLNRSISQFQFRGGDVNNKPNDVSENGEKIGGHAVQNWCLLRIFPILVGDRVTDYSDEVWELVLLLRQIVEYICAPKINEGDVAYLHVLIENYLYLRYKLFPDKSLKPKHHYLHHYPQLIIELGPLIRIWTLRFESKHSYFRRCARMLQNFKNICSTLAERHQLYQAYLSAGNLFPPVLQARNPTPFFASSYCEAIRESVVKFQFSPENTSELSEVTYKGTTYRKGLYVIIDTDEGHPVFGRIVVILTNYSKTAYKVHKETRS